MASKRTTLPKDFEDLLEAGDLVALQGVFDKCRLDARGGFDKGTALSFASCPDELARWLVEQGLDVDAPNLTAQRTPLHDRAGSWSSIAVLVELGADVDARDKRGLTVMHAAVTKPQHVALLIASGAELDPVTDRGVTPLRALLSSCQNADIPRVAESAALLLAAGAAVPDNAQALVTRIGTSFEFHRSGFNVDLLDETDAGLQRLYELFDVRPVPRRVPHDGSSPIRVTATDVSGQYDELWALLVPSSGPAGTVQGEVLRLAGKISREIAGNGSVNWDDDFRAMVDDLGVLLVSGDRVGDPDELAAVLRRLRTGAASDAELRSVRDAAVDWILANPNPTPLPTPSYRR
jgi:hypothetical protein